MAGIPLGTVFCIHLEFLTDKIMPKQMGNLCDAQIVPLYIKCIGTLLHKCSSETVGTLDLDFEALLKKKTQNCGLQKRWQVNDEHMCFVNNAGDKLW